MSTSELEANYSAAFGASLAPGQRPALLLIDFVAAYFDPGCELYAKVDAALASALRVRDAARLKQVPVIYTNVRYQAGGADGGIFFRKIRPLRHFVAGNRLGNWVDGLEPHENEIVVTKQYASAFFGTSLAATLTSLSVDTVILTGLTTSGCIRASCVDAISCGFIPIVVADACGDRHPEPHRANLFDMNAKYADVISESDAVKYLNDLPEGFGTGT